MKAALQMRQKQQAQEDWIARYGHIRPVIATDNWGKKFVAFGTFSTVGIGSSYRIFCSHCFTRIWKRLVGRRGKPKPEGERHQVFQWRVEFACVTSRLALCWGETNSNAGWHDWGLFVLRVQSVRDKANKAD